MDFFRTNLGLTVSVYFQRRAYMEMFFSSTPGPGSAMEESVEKGKKDEKIKSLALSSHTCKESREPGRAFSC